MSGPRHDTDLTILFDRIQQDLQNAGRYEEYLANFNHVKQINPCWLLLSSHIPMSVCPATS